jgi:hypothetical protein
MPSSHAKAAAMKLSFFVSLILSAVLLVGNNPAQAEDQRTSCVEPAVSVANNLRSKRASTGSDCSPEIALDKAREQARMDAKQAITEECIRRVAVTEAQALCRAHGMALPDPGVGIVMSEAPIARSGQPEIDDAQIIRSYYPKVCAVIRDIPRETQTWRTPAGVQNGGCIFNNGRITHKRARSRAFCAVQCMPL